MEILIFWIIVICFIVFFYKKHKKVQFVEHHAPVIKEKAIVGYKKKYRIMNASESALFFELRKQLPQNYYVFPNMRIADVVDAIDGRGFYRRLNKILPRHVDFVVCNQDFKPIVVIELNGGYHNRLDQQERDVEKKEVFEQAKLPLIVVGVGENFMEVVEKMIKNYVI